MPMTSTPTSAISPAHAATAFSPPSFPEADTLLVQPMGLARSTGPGKSSGQAKSSELAKSVGVAPSTGGLEGEVEISGAKNSVLKVMAATTLAPGHFVISNVPRISDVIYMAELLVGMGSQVEWSGANQLTILTPESLHPVAPYHLVQKLRASISLLGPLLSRCGEASVALPGGDDFGPRPVDMHLGALEDLGAEIELSHGVITAKAAQLQGARVVLEFPSVGATENILMAAVRAKGKTVIENAAREPEIADLASFLSQMGASFAGVGTSTLEVFGAEEMRPVERAVIPDRIEASTFLVALSVVGGEITLKNARPEHLDMVTRKFGEMNMRISPSPEGLWAMCDRRLKAADVATLPYPGIPTDVKPLMVAALAYADGVGIVTENLFAGRFRYVDELVRMGADIRSEGQHAIVRGKEKLSGAPVQGHDIRATAALLVAGLGAEGETEIAGAQHLDRGYEDLVGKLNSLGANIRRI